MIGPIPIECLLAYLLIAALILFWFWQAMRS
jgi:hypothetical protein